MTVTPIDPSEAVKVAANHGWEATIIVVGILLGLFGVSWLVRFLLRDSHDREERLAGRVTLLETRYSDTLVTLVEKTVCVIEQNTAATTIAREESKLTRESNEALIAASDSWRRHTEESQAKVSGCLEQFGSDCQKRWDEVLPEALKKHLPAVLEAMGKKQELHGGVE